MRAYGSRRVRRWVERGVCLLLFYDEERSPCPGGSVVVVATDDADADR